MTRPPAVATAALLIGLAACDNSATRPHMGDSGDPHTVPGPAQAFTPGGTTFLTRSAADQWPELEGDFVAWYRSAPAGEQGLWLMDLRTGDSSRVWAGRVQPEFDLVDGRIVWGGADALYAYEIATGALERLASGFIDYRHITVGPRYITGSARQGSFRPFVYDRSSGTEALIPTPAAVPATRGWDDWLVYSYSTDNRTAQLYLHHIPTGGVTPLTDQDRLLSSALADIEYGRVVFCSVPGCAGPMGVYDVASGSNSPLALPSPSPMVLMVDGDVLAYRQRAGFLRSTVGFHDLVSGENTEFAVSEPSTRRVDVDLDGSRVVHTSSEGLTLLDLRFQTAEPPVADAGGPYETVEGTPLTLDGSGSWSPNGGALGYEWSLEDGTVLEGVAPSWTGADDGQVAVVLTVTDAEGLSASDETTIRVLNAPPVVSLGSSGTRTAGASTLTGVAGEPVHLVARFSDPGHLDAPWSWSVSWDEGEIDSGTMETQGDLPPVSWTPERPGIYTVVVRVRDKDGGEATAELALDVDLPAVEVHAGTGPRHTVPALRSNGVFPVVVFGMTLAPAEDFDLEAFRLGPKGAMPAAAPLASRGHAPVLEDRNGDGILDVVLTFRVAQAGLTPNTHEVCVRGQTRSGSGVTTEGEQLQGCSPIRIAGGGRS